MRFSLKTLDRQRLGVKLLLGFSGVLLVGLALGVQSLVNLNAMKNETLRIYEKELLGISHIKEANINLIYVGRALRQMMIAPDAAARDKARQDVVVADATLRRARPRARGSSGRRTSGFSPSSRPTTPAICRTSTRRST